MGPTGDAGSPSAMQRLLCLVSLVTVSGITPVQKVGQMLEAMKDKATKQMQEEQVQFASYKQFCEQTAEEKGRSIKEASEKIETLDADIEAATAESNRLGQEIAQHLADLEGANGEKAKATGLREKGRADFVATLKDYSESIDAIGRALKVLKEEKQSTALVELSAVRGLKLVPATAASSIDAYLAPPAAAAAAPRGGSLLEAPEPKTYEFQSGGVIGMLEGLQDKFVDERISLEKEEAAKKHSYEMLVQSLDAQLAQSKKEQTQKSQFQAKKLQFKATMEGELEETKSEKATDEKYAEDLKATCEKKSAAFDARQKIRKEELEALSKAQDIIASGAVSGSAEKHLPKLLQTTSLASLRSKAPEQVARFLQQRATELNSRVLSAAAARVGADPMAKVKTMIEQLITKMQEQANEEATKKGWCDAELSTNKATREEKTDAADALKAEIEDLQSAIVKLGEEITTLNSEVTELNSAMANATAMRKKEGLENNATIKDAKEAQEAVASALQVLREFYAKAAGAKSLVQTAQSSVAHAPDIFSDEPYTGLGGESGGVVSMMEVIESDFAHLQAETEAQEEAAKSEYQEFMEDSKVDKAVKIKTGEHKTNKKTGKSEELVTLEGDLAGTNKELEAANAYFEKLKPDCFDTGVSYAERKAQREEELKDLQTALKMLETL